MDRYDRLLRAGCMALIPALMAGCSACMIARALGLAAPWAGAYLLALGAASAVRLIRRGGAWALGAGVALAAAFCALVAVYAPRFLAMARLLAQGADAAALDAARAAVGRGVAYLCAFLFGALLAELMRAPSGASFALLVTLASVIFALAAREGEISLWAALPGLVAGVAAFGLPSDARRDGVPPLLLIPALLLAVLALALTPGERVTWEPLERLAERVRAIVEDYIRFTEERVAFSIGEKGYDRAGMIGQDVVSMLGGPANPTEDAVMRVETDVDLLLRGTIKRSYTGYSWVDDQPKARYLYYDFTHRRVRDQVFDSNTTADNAAFAAHKARVELLGGGTSTLFVPAQLASFEMGLEDAVYYNSAGEIFLTREARLGDSYALIARLPRSDEALIQAAEEHMGDADPALSDARENYTALPPNIDSRVYDLALALTQDSSNPAQKAFAIQDHLAHNYRYTLDGGFPEGNEDFVSWFLMESKEGYCSYFASAMAVMCRMAGLPARYVEGYHAEAVPGGESIVTGENAHAWVEVYLNGLGWIPFDPTAAAQNAQGYGSQRGDSSNGGSSRGEDTPPEGSGEPDPGEGEPTPSPTPAPQNTPTPNPDGGDSSPSPDEGGQDDGGDWDGGFDGAGDEGDDDSDGDDNQGESDPPSDSENPPETPPDANDAPDNENQDRNLNWLWTILLLLALAALGYLLYRWARRRLEQTDPLRLSARPRDMDEAALLLYRATLTLLMQLGYAPQSGETPVAFAVRASGALGIPEYLRFAQGVARCRYAGVPAEAKLLKDGRIAYLRLLNALSRFGRLRFHARRMLRGLGSTEVIP